MNLPLNDPRHPWARLTTAARTVLDARDASAPLGFATRVSALGLAGVRPLVSLFELFALRALAVACLLAIVSIAVNYSELSRRIGGASSSAGDDMLLAGSDAVSVVLALAD